MAPSRETLESVVHRYFDACNGGDQETFGDIFVDGAVHYLPDGMFGPVHGHEALAEGWQRDREANGATWTVDSLLTDERRGLVLCEWTAFKPGRGKLYRGVDLFVCNDAGRIEEVRVYYAAPRDDTMGVNELGGFPYAERNWPMPDYEIRPDPA